MTKTLTFVYMYLKYSKLCMQNFIMVQEIEIFRSPGY